MFGNCICLFFLCCFVLQHGCFGDGALFERRIRVGAIRITGSSELEELTALVGVGMAARGCRLSLR